jgi:simple sugar transport system ATP-binding protein
VPKAVELSHISKHFGRLAANDDVSLAVEAGTIHALVGENGAGKSTLMKILYGLYQPDAGTLRVRGVETRIRSPLDALALGLGMVHQHFMLVRPLTVAENVVLGIEPGFGPLFGRRRAEQEVAVLSRRYGLIVDPHARVENLSVGEEQRVEILKVLHRGASVLILDEPTAVLTPQEVDELFAVLRKLREGGTTILLITHKLREVMEISDRVTVLRGGKVVGERATAETSITELAALMVGRPVPLEREKTPARTGEVRLEVRDLRVRDDRGLEAVRGVSLTVRGGEIVGVAGVEGNGQAEWIDALAGLRRPAGGFVALRGRNVTRALPAARFRAGLAHVPADRLRRGLVPDFTLAENSVLGLHRERRFGRGPFLSRRALRRHARTLLADHDVRPADPEALARNLSGGNQQRLVVGRELSRRARVLLVAHPTRGVDLGAIEQIHARLLRERDRGRAVLLFSSELSELLALADRIVVLYEGRIVHETPANRTSERSLGLYMTGHREPAGASTS